MIELGLILLIVGLSWWLRPSRVRQRWLEHVARHSRSPEQRQTAARLLGIDAGGDLHS